MNLESDISPMLPNFCVYTFILLLHQGIKCTHAVHQEVNEIHHSFCEVAMNTLTKTTKHVSTLFTPVTQSVFEIPSLSMQ